ncbi:hypothetical protein RBH29_13700 [Herbivorax sp. ANBcel31]|uniref:hypothetical protein n=1 Tax=Herbivorax sp. ANBcel31 TaxID=3069754 RepID=UPI0027B30E7F|nr:hypothetical protein [Herbivorax sp. ANBcel31]MDQ2087481.1 hypothetical protein [Herbivorax sp. ANBcel31]
MVKSNNLISKFYQKQKQYGYLKSIELSREINDNGSSAYSLKIILCGYPFYEGEEQLLLIFFGVRDFKASELDGLCKTFINITDRSNQQLEGIKYRVKEDENEMFSFTCKSFEFKII